MYRILFVDDEVIYKLTIQNLVEWKKYGFTIAGTASNGVEAMEFLKKNTVHAIITDLQMPLMDGVSLIRKLRQQGFEGPILALSNYSDYTLVRGALTAGAFDYLIKMNITKEQLGKSLSQMAEILDYSSTNSPKEAPPDNQTLYEQELTRLQSYLTNPSISLPPLAFPRFSDRFPFPMIGISLILKTSKHNYVDLAEFLRSAVSESFHNTASFCPIRVAENEFLFLCPRRDLTESHIPKKLMMLSKQVEVFLSTPAMVTYSSDLLDFPSVKRFCRLTSQGLARVFYEKNAGVLQINTENVAYKFNSQRTVFLSSVLSALRNRDHAALLANMHAFVEFCSQLMVDPMRFRNAFVILIECSRDIGTIGSSVEKTHSMINTIEQSATASSLVNTISDFLSQNISFQNAPSESIRPEIAKTLLYISRCYMDKITLDEVAKHVGLSKEYISRLFLKEVGVNLFHYIGDVRMRKAAEILSNNPSALVKEVAASVGFDNQYFFSTKFKEYYGVSPNTYREQHMISGSPDDPQSQDL